MTWSDIGLFAPRLPQSCWCSLHVQAVYERLHALHEKWACREYRTMASKRDSTKWIHDSQPDRVSLTSLQRRNVIWMYIRFYFIYNHIYTQFLTSTPMIEWGRNLEVWLTFPARLLRLLFWSCQSANHLKYNLLVQRIALSFVCDKLDVPQWAGQNDVRPT